MLVAVLVTSAIALLDAWTGGRAILLGLLIAGPLLAAASLDPQHTAIIALYASALRCCWASPAASLAPLTTCWVAWWWRPGVRWAPSWPTVAPSRSNSWGASPGS